MKKGFTLAEILGVIVIIGLLLILIVPPIINRISSSGDEAKKAENEFIYEETDIYIKEHPDKYPPGKSGKYCILIQDLIDEGKLVEPVTDVVTGENLSDKSVLVTIYSTGTTEYAIKEGAECKDISALPMIDFIIEPTGSSWVKKRTVTIIYPTIEGNYQARYRREDENSNNWINDNAYNNGGRHTNIVFNKSTKSTQIEAQLKGNQIISGRVNVVNVDSDLPQISSININGKSGNGLNVTVKASDRISGLNGIYFSTVPATPNENASGWIAFNSNDGESKTYSRVLNKGTYYVFVKDKAGNISNNNNGNSNKITITDATYHSGYYYCPSGYTSSGSGSSMQCYKYTYTSNKYSAGYYSCSKGIMEGTRCVSNWIFVTGTVQCKDGYTEWHTDYHSLYDECDDSRYKENGDCSKEVNGQHHPTTYCRYIYGSRTYHPGYYYCPSGYTEIGSGSSMRCRKTSYTSNRYSSPYYSCPSGYTLIDDICYQKK